MRKQDAKSKKAPPVQHGLGTTNVGKAPPLPSGDTAPDQNPYSNQLRRPYPKYKYSGHPKDKHTKHPGKYVQPVQHPGKGIVVGRFGGGVLAKGV